MGYGEESARGGGYAHGGGSLEFASLRDKKKRGTLLITHVRFFTLIALESTRFYPLIAFTFIKKGFPKIV